METGSETSPQSLPGFDRANLLSVTMMNLDRELACHSERGVREEAAEVWLGQRLARLDGQK